VGPNAWQQIHAIVEQMVADGRLQQWGQQVVLDEERPLP
jgi:hypothetical protein